MIGRSRRSVTEGLAALSRAQTGRRWKGDGGGSGGGDGSLNRHERLPARAFHRPGLEVDLVGYLTQEYEGLFHGRLNPQLGVGLSLNF